MLEKQRNMPMKIVDEFHPVLVSYVLIIYLVGKLIFWFYISPDSHRFLYS